MPVLATARAPIAVRRAFRGVTLVELLVVLVVIGLLIAMIAAVGGNAIYSQRVANTRSTMNTISLAIEQFATEKPLKMIYNLRTATTFGAYPPYQLDRPAGSSVSYLLEPTSTATTPYNLANRIGRDLGLTNAGSVNILSDRHDDNRALYIYLKMFSAGALEQVPPAALKPIRTGVNEYLNPTGSASSGPPSVATQGRFDVFGFHDAWNVPLDYFLHVKVEWLGGSNYRITERVPVLRSLGLSREQYDAAIIGGTGTDPQKWLFSSEFPSPAAEAGNAGFWNNGGLSSSSSANGWARAKAFGETYGYVPDLTRDK